MHRSGTKKGIIEKCTASAIKKALRLLYFYFSLPYFLFSLQAPLSWLYRLHRLFRPLHQPDGSVFQARQWGDEWKHGWETTEGYTILKNSTSNTWEYALISDNGDITSSGKAVGRDTPPKVPLHIRPIGESRKKTLPLRDINPSERRQNSVGPQSVVPATGTGYIPVILVNFSDTTTTYTDTNFEALLFGTGNNSMKDYYEEVSYGAFTVSAGSAGVVDWYTAANTHDYYGTNVSGDDQYPATLVREAVVAADAAVDFSEYDLDGDCYVDVVAIVHQGTGEEAGGSTTDIWSHSWNLNSASSNGDGSGAYTTNDSAGCGNIVVNDYIIQPEILYGNMQTMGVFAHEYGHALGLPDLYDTDGSSEGIGYWGLMAAGSWNYVTRDGDSPAHLSAWSKYKLGWITPTKVTSTLISEPIAEAASNDDVYQFLDGSPSGGGQYFLVENRNQSGFDAGLPASGLAIWHIDESKANNKEECTTATGCSSTHYKVALEQADGNFDLEKNSNRGDSGDLYVGGAAWNATTTPNSLLYDGTDNQLAVSSISSAGSSMTATLDISSTVPPPPEEDCVFDDPSFEAGSPNSYWTETSINFGTPLCDSSCGTGGQSYQANTGSWWAWFGGSYSDETGTLQQNTIITAEMKNITFYLAVPSADTPGYLQLLIDGDTVWEITDSTADSYASGYEQVSVDISAYADNTSHSVSLVSTTSAGDITNFWVDDVCLTDESGFCWHLFLPAITNKPPH